MHKSLKMGIFAAIGVGAILLLAYHFLTEATARTRDTSVAALHEKLAGLKTAKIHAETQIESKRATVKIPPAPDLEQLRVRWRTLFGDMAESHGNCQVEDSFHRAVVNCFLGIRSTPLTEEERSGLLAYLDCTRTFRAELLSLTQHPVTPSELYDPTFRMYSYESRRAFYTAEDYLRGILIYVSSVDEHATAIQVQVALLNISRLNTRHSSHWNFDSIVDWSIVQKALDSGTVAQEVWDQFLQALSHRRDQRDLVEEVIYFSESLTADLDGWPGKNVKISFSEHPLIYSQNWAYRHVTTPLYNHDVDRFSRAMAVLLDLAQEPYYKSREGLADFCDDFDVEPSTDDLKFIRNNSTWRYVLKFSREGFWHTAIEQATIDIARIAILLERHQDATGEYPETLESLADDFGGRLPLNPLDGEAYIYIPEGETFRLGYREWLNGAGGHEQEKPFEHFTFWNDHLGSYATEYFLSRIDMDRDESHTGN